MSSVSIGVAGIILDNLTIADDSIYFIDEGGYIVGGSTINDTEEFIGYVNPVLFQQLLNDKIFVQHVIEGYDKKKCTTNNSYSANYNITVRSLISLINIIFSFHLGVYSILHRS